MFNKRHFSPRFLFVYLFQIVNLLAFQEIESDIDHVVTIIIDIKSSLRQEQPDLENAKRRLDDLSTEIPVSSWFQRSGKSRIVRNSFLDFSSLSRTVSCQRSTPKTRRRYPLIAPTNCTKSLVECSQEWTSAAVW